MNSHSEAGVRRACGMLFNKLYCLGHRCKDLLGPAEQNISEDHLSRVSHTPAKCHNALSQLCDFFQQLVNDLKELNL